MTATVAASKSYDLASPGPMREDLEDVIYDISPMDTWALSSFGRGRCKSTTHEWLTDSLASPSATTSIEGDTFSASYRTPPQRLKNYTCINRVEFEVSGTTRAVDNAGMADLLGYHTARAAKELKRNIETAILGNYPASAGTSVSPRVSAGIPNWLTVAQHIKLTGQTTFTTTAPVSGFATSTCPGTGSATTFLSADLNNMLQQAWSMGGEVDTVLTTAAVYQTISAFTSIATRFRDVQSRAQAQIIGAADVYVSPFGSHNIRISRYIPAGYVFALDQGTWGVSYLRPFETIEVAQVGDADRRMILAEWTLVAKSPTANTQTRGAA